MDKAIQILDFLKCQETSHALRDSSSYVLILLLSFHL
jgi:hypothetical protein